MKINTLWVLFGNISNTIVLALFTLFSARLLGPENLGYFSFWVGIVSILAKGNEIFSQSILFRRLSEDITRTNELTYFIFGRITINVIIILIGILLYIFKIIGFDLLFLFLVPLISYRIDGLRSVLETPFKASYKMKVVIKSQLIDSIILLVAVVFLTIGKYETSIDKYIMIYVFSSLPGFFILSKFSNKDIYNPKNIGKSILFLEKIALDSRPIFIYGIITVILSNIDYLILKLFGSIFDMGLLSASLRITIPLSIIPGIITTSFFPLLVKRSNKEEFEKLNSLVVTLLTFIPLVASVVWFSGSDNFTKVLFGAEYSEGALLPGLLFIHLVYSFLIFYCVDFSIASGSYRQIVISALIILISSFIAGSILYQLYGLHGLVAAKIFASVTGFGYLIIKLPNRIGIAIAHIKIIGIISVSVLIYFSIQSIINVNFITNIILLFFSIMITTYILSSEVRQIIKSIITLKNA